jgi:heat shock protein HslJ
MKKTILVLTLGICCLAFKKSEDDLSGSNWLFIGFGNNSNNEIRLADSTCLPDLQFNKNGTYQGNTGLNFYLGNYTLTEDNQISMDTVSATRYKSTENCRTGESVTRQYPYMRRFRIKDDTLFLSSNSCSRLLFKRLKSRTQL